MRNQTGQWVVGGAAVSTGVNKVLSKVDAARHHHARDERRPEPDARGRDSAFPQADGRNQLPDQAPAPFENQDRRSSRWTGAFGETGR